MAQVPYNPVPSVSLSSKPSPYLRVPGSVEAAAGVGVAQAVQGLGREVSHASDTLAADAIMLQNRVNEVNATDKATKFEDALSQEVANFDQLQGINAVNELPAFRERVRKLQEDSLSSAANPAERRMINQVTQRRTGYAIVDAGHKAGTRLRQAEDDAAKGRMERAQRDFDPRNANLGGADIQTVKAEVQKYGRTHGMLPDTIANVEQKEVSKAWLNGFKKMAPVEPDRANEIFEQVKETLDPAVRDEVQAIVNRSMATKQTTIDTDEIFKRAQFDPKKGTGQFQRLLDLSEPFKTRNENNPDYAKFLDNEIKNRFSTAMAGYRDTQRGYERDVGEFILGKNSGNPIVSMSGITGADAPQAVRDAFNALEPSAQRRIISAVGHAAHQANPTWTNESIERFQTLKGMASDPERVKDFIEMNPADFLKENIPNEAKNTLFNLQRNAKMKAADLQNSALSRAMISVEPLLRAAGIQPKSDEYSQFRGAMEDQLQDYLTEKKTQAPREEIQKIAARLLQNTAKDRSALYQWWYGTPYYKAKPDSGMLPEHVRQGIAADIRARLGEGVEPTEEMLQRGYAFWVYKNEFDKEKTKPSSALAPK